MTGDRVYGIFIYPYIEEACKSQYPEGTSGCVHDLLSDTTLLVMIRLAFARMYGMPYSSYSIALNDELMYVDSMMDVNQLFSECSGFIDCLIPLLPGLHDDSKVEPVIYQNGTLIYRTQQI